MTVNIGVIGAGYWGPNIARNFNQIPEANLYEVCDLDDERLKSMEAAFPKVRFSRNYLYLLNNLEIDAVAIATPAATHYEITKKALMHEKHVLVEKPLALSVNEAEELVDLAAKHGKVLMGEHTYEYHPAVRKIKELISQGELGDIHYIYSERLNLGIIRQDLNVMWNLAPHDISIMLYLLEKEPVEVTACGGTYLQEEIEDVAFINLKFPNGVVGHIHVSWLDPKKVRQVTVVGSKKMLVFDDTNSEEKIKIYDKGVTKQEFYDSYGEFLNLRFGDIHVPRIEKTEPLKIACSHFIDCIKENKKPISGGMSGLRVVEVLERAQKSLRGEVNGKASL